MKMLYRVEEACMELGGICPRTFFKLVSQGKLRTVKLGRRTLVRREDLEAVVRSLACKEAA